ncbi:MAG: T9SS type A sorting domain-containing protein [Saprospiraceae bacterium]
MKENKLNIDDESPGFYLIQIKLKNQRITRKIIKR